MGDSDLVSGQPRADGAPHEGDCQPMMWEFYGEDASRPLQVISSQTLLAKDAVREYQNCTKRLVLGRSMSASRQPPLNFSVVSEGLYRSGYPQTQDYSFMETLKLKTIVTLVRKEFPDGYQEFIQANGITHKIFDMAGTKKEDIPVEMMRAIHEVVSNPENHPLLVHCNQGKHRTGCVVGVFRKSNQWDVKRIIDEYITFAEPKIRETDLKYLTEFQLASLGHQTQEVALFTSSNRFYRFAIVVIFALFAFYPLSKFKVHEPRPKTN